MDVSDITKVASRKRMSEDAEKLRDKISRETAKIIKLKVAQDTAYWDLKEKLQQVESNHERLQQNMVEVQMQHETISGQYQDELRLRPEILNKVCGTRSICDVLEEYGARLRSTVSRAHADRAALGASSRAAAARVQRLRAAAERALTEQQHRAAAAHHTLRTAGERYAAMAREAEAGRKAAEAAAHEARARLEAEAARRDRAQADADRLTAQLRRTTADLDRKDRLISEMQKETQRVVSELETRIDSLEHVVTQQRTELETRAAEGEETRRVADEDARQLRTQIQELHNTLMETEASVENLNRTVTTLSENNEQLTRELREKKQALEQKDDVIQELEVKFSALEVEKGSLASEVSAAEEARATAEAECDRLREHLRELQRTEQQLRDEFAQYRCESERGAAEKESQLTAAGDSIARLMRDVQAEADARHRLELAAKTKDDELARHLALLVDIKNENERLRATIASMEATIDNIQKELTSRVAAACGAMNADRRQRPERLRADPTPPPPPPPPLDHMLYNFLSDASNDADTHDSPLSLSQVKRNLNAKSRAFFKSKRCDAKYKKHK